MLHLLPPIAEVNMTAQHSLYRHELPFVPLKAFATTKILQKMKSSSHASLPMLNNGHNSNH